MSRFIRALLGKKDIEHRIRSHQSAEAGRRLGQQKAIEKLGLNPWQFEGLQQAYRSVDRRNRSWDLHGNLLGTLEDHIDEEETEEEFIREMAKKGRDIIDGVAREGHKFPHNEFA